MSPTNVSPTMIHGHVAPGFEAVEAEFRKNFAERGELGAAITIYSRGSKVVDLWGGYRDRASRAQWDQDTMEIVFSTTKGMSAMAQILARQRPEWDPGTRWGYHAVTLGFYENELVRRTDPKHRSIGRFFTEEVAAPLGIEFYIGLPNDVSLSRIGTLEVNSNKFAWVLGTLKQKPRTVGMVLGFMNPNSLSSRVLNSPLMVQGADYSNPEYRGVEFPATGGIGQARAIARTYSAVATGASEPGITPQTMAALEAPAVAPSGGETDLVQGMEIKHSLGFGKPSQNLKFGSSDSAFGWAARATPEQIDTKCQMDARARWAPRGPAL